MGIRSRIGRRFAPQVRLLRSGSSGPLSHLRVDHSPTFPPSSARAVCLMIVSIVGIADLAVLVVEKDESDGDRSNGEEQEGHEEHHKSLGVLENTGHALGGADGDVDAAAERKEVAKGVLVDVGLGDDDDAEDDAGAAEEVEGEGLRSDEWR